MIKPADAAPLILIVDDDHGMRESLSILLTIQGFQVEAVTGPAEALARLGNVKRVDLVIADINMRPASGFDLARSVQMLEPLAARPAMLLMSGLRMETEQRAALPPVVAGFIQKPFRASSLRDAVQDALARRQR